MQNSGILLKKVDWKSSNIIIEILTKNRGKQSYIVYSAKKRFFSPPIGSFIEFIEKKSKSDLLSIKEWNVKFIPINDKNILYSIIIITLILQKIHIEHESINLIYNLSKQTILEINNQKIDEKLIISCFLIKLLYFEGLLFLGEMNCENCNKLIEKRDKMYYDFNNNKKYCKLCEKKYIFNRYNSSVLIFINWYIGKEYINLKGVKLPFKVEELLNFLVNYIKFNLIEIHIESILNRIITRGE